ncbi:hypothetical protein A2483_01990 [Candidatus Peregrinibacteria bacterium RIFOXYC2_FULL_33_13]|nr:MAG: hypothetical protein A2483_01990 [Candidatus Peregrinibacteria bacterium RIFOXYC2_FULL_33_13]
MKECGYSEPEDKIMEGPVSVTYGFEDEIMPVKKIYEFSKQMEGLKILGGYMNKRLMSYN